MLNIILNTGFMIITNKLVKEKKFSPRIIKNYLPMAFFCSDFSSWKKKTQNKYSICNQHSNPVSHNHSEMPKVFVKQFCFWIFIYLNLRLGWHCYGFDWVLLWQSFLHPEAWLSFQLHPAIFDFIYDQNFKLDTVWPKPTWIKVKKSWLLLPLHQSTYPRGPESASIVIPPFKPKFT